MLLRDVCRALGELGWRRDIPFYPTPLDVNTRVNMNRACVKFVFAKLAVRASLYAAALVYQRCCVDMRAYL
jgi:hypothetical protein